ncbi:MAG: choice-of-anchor J domain-containing protein [Muribaculaceae bacterium]
MKKFYCRMASVLLSAAVAVSAIADNVVLVEGFDTQDDFNKWTVVNVEEGSVTWSYRTSTGKPMQSKCAQILKHTPNNANDWLISQPVQLEAGTLYELSFRATPGTFNKTEHLKAYLGTSATVEGMTRELINLDNMLRDDAADITRKVEFTVDASGNYYLGFLGCSPADQGRIDLDDITVTAKASANAPAPVSNLVITPGSLGALTATVSFTAPSLTSTGGVLASLSAIEIYRDGTLITTIDTPQPGADISYTDNSAVQGFNTYSVICDTDGSKSVESSARAFIGIDIPVAVADPRATCLNDGVINLSWNAPTASVNGGYFDAATLKYIITNLADGATTTVSGTSHQMKFELGVQALYEFSIAAVADAGTGAASSFNRVIMGNPITEAYAESFANATAHSLWYQDSDDADFEWIIDDPENEEYSDPDVKDYIIYAQDCDHGDLIALTEYAFENETSRFCSPLFNLSGFVNPVLTFYVINGPKKSLKPQVRVPGGDWTDLAEAVWETGINGLQWSRCTVPLANLSNAGTIQFSFLASGGERAIHIDNISISDSGVAHDLAVRSISVYPRRANIGETSTFTIDMRNLGGVLENDYAVVLYRDGVEVERKAGAELKATESTTMSFTYVATIDDATAEEKSEWTAAVLLSTDENGDNNNSQPVVWSARLNDVPTPSGLTATASDEGLLLTWDAAITREASQKGEIQYTTDDFEAYETFAISGIGGWTLVDCDQSPTWGTNYPKREHVGEPLSFMVFNTVAGEVQTDEHQDNVFFAHSGQQYMMGFSNAVYGTPNDDWLITPRLDGRAHTIDFYARIPMGMSGDDIIDVTYSTTDTDPDSFYPVVGGENIHIQDNWKHVSLDVPEGARYCAVNLKQSQMFFELDDFTYAAHDGSLDALTLAGYNVYRNGEKINESPVAEPRYTDITAPANATAIYKVTTVYEQGESRYSNEVSVTDTGVDDVSVDTVISVKDNVLSIHAATEVSIVIYRIDGTPVASLSSSASEVMLESGIYIVSIDGKALKVRI